MKVLLVFVTQLLVTFSVTVPPVWPSEKSSEDLFDFESFFAKDDIPKFSKKFSNFQHIYHPLTVDKQAEKNIPKNHSPHSFQIIHFENQKEVPVLQETTEKQNHQHQTKVQQSEEAEINDDSLEEKEELSEHEKPFEIPTKPIYPGEGQLAKYGKKHKPFIHPQKNAESLENSSNENKKLYNSEEEKPEGYETFQKEEENFQKFQDNFHHDLNTFPEKHKLEPSQINSEEESEPLYEKPEIGYIPEKLYTQVRKTESTAHLPRLENSEEDEDASRLREVIKDSTIHTVYTEEGYEDSAYDHAGHEKNAENHEDHAQSAEDQRKILRKPKRRGNLRNNEIYRKNYEKEDADIAGSDNESKQINATLSLTPMKNIRRIKLKNGDYEEYDMEVVTEIKYTPQKRKHKYVKIVPVVKKDKEIKRVKRYDKEKLSKLYVRKRPAYYWKKKKTTTTERPLHNNNYSRNKFEAAFMIYAKSSTKPSTTSSKEEILETTTKLSTTTTLPLTTSTVKYEDIHPDLLNPELTTKSSKPSLPKVLPVKIKKFQSKRSKRYVNDFPNIDIDLKEFVDVSKLPDPTKKPNYKYIKYPYYKLPLSSGLHENSPLRYAENIKTIPIKIENQMSFYESKSDIKCPEIESDINPIPDRIQNQIEGEETDKMADTPDLPRLKGLGDKIDCLKIKYFGEDPLDSPFFDEKVINDPLPIFKSLNDKNSNKRELNVQILTPIIVLDETDFDAATINPIHQNSKAVLKPPYTLTELMQMSAEKKLYKNPNETTVTKKTTSQKSFTESQETRNIDTISSVASPEAKRTGTDFVNNINSSSIKPQKQLSDILRKKPVKIIRKLPVKKILKPSKKKITKPEVNKPTESSINSFAKQINQNISSIVEPIIPKPSSKVDNLLMVQSSFNWKPESYKFTSFPYIFDISRYLPTISNLQMYNDDNNDKLNEPQHMYNEVIKSIDDAKDFSTNEFMDEFKKEENNISETKNQNITIKFEKNNNESTVNIEQKSNDNNGSYTETIIGLLPPSLKSYNSNYNLKNMNNRKEELNTRPNYFQHPIIKPTRVEKMIIKRIHKRDTSNTNNKKNKNFINHNEEEDLLMEASENHPVHVSPPLRKPKIYTEIVRTRPSRPPTEEEIDEEDLNPRKRLYEFKSSTTQTYPVIKEDTIVEEEDVEVTTTPKPIIYPVEANPDNPNVAQYIFFIEKLHEKWAKEDATSTTESKPETTSEEPKTMIKQVITENINERRGEPTYLQIINQLHQIQKEEDDKTTTTTQPTTTETFYHVSVKNSNPFTNYPDDFSFMSELSNIKDKFHSDNMAEGSSNPEISSKNRNFTSRFKTAVDTSKYKTIDRGGISLRHNLSSRYNSEDQTLPLINGETTQTPMLMTILTNFQLTTLPSQEEEEKVTEFTLPETTTEHEEEQQTTTTRTRQRNRFRPRPTTTSSTTSTFPTLTHRRRRPSRITTTTPSTATIFTSPRRRFRQKTAETQTIVTEIPVNPYPTTTEKLQIVTPITNDETKKQRRYQTLEERRITSRVKVTKVFEPADELKDIFEEPKKQQYDIIGPLQHTDTRHGGNYRHIKDQPISDNSGEPSISEKIALLTGSSLASNINQLKENDEEILVEKTHLSSEETPKLSYSKVSLYPNMARMINRLAETKIDEKKGEELIKEDNKPAIIKDPSKRMYYYAKL